jgi:methylmalonyl-CoA/ethylmalonyl-CoA epimerase
MIIKINHVAIVLPELDEGVGFWAGALGLEVEARRREATEEVDIAFLPVGESDVELLAPFTDSSGVAKYLAKRGPGIHHICFEVDNLEETLQRLKDHHVPLIDETPRTNAAGQRMAFIHPKGTGGVLIELYESQSERS